MLLLTSLLLLFVGKGFSATCEVDSNNNCKATCNGTIQLDISKVLQQYPYDISVDPSAGVASYFLFSPCDGVQCKETDDFVSSVCLGNEKGEQSSCGQPGATFTRWELVSTKPYVFWVTYQGGECEGARCKQTNITFIEDTSDPTTIQYIDFEFYYNFQVFGKCIGQVTDGCSGSSSKHHKSHFGIIGFVLMLLAVIGITTYFIAGILIMKFHQGAQGKELIPNYGFWTDLPFLIKDGFLFTISPCYKRKSDYENLK